MPALRWEPDRRPSYQRLLAANGIAEDDGVAIHYTGEEISIIVISRSNAKAYKVCFDKENKEIELDTKYLGTRQNAGSLHKGGNLLVKELRC